MTNLRSFLSLAFLLTTALQVHLCQGFQIASSPPGVNRFRKEGHAVLSRSTSKKRPQNQLFLAPDSISNAAFLLSDGDVESWREYVPLVVSVGVLLDIVLGSPAANAALSLARSPEEGDDADGPAPSPMELLQRAASGEDVMSGAGVGKNSKERVDTVAVAQRALDKASATKELRAFLEDNKSDWDKIRDVQRQMDLSIAKFDEKIEQQKDESA
uniref:Uncharacterized protein n=1 Tax=Entomoneis paludosa TaxID=265537 RepID=A0A7S2YKA2_9STRA|mmetsp:Transcript_36234/g.75371  ORF Transcript_36234/g.75371 Transcript_36234/m.75371 type:complete len:214 (+) Transcript_36234:99-740(+)